MINYYKEQAELFEDVFGEDFQEAEVISKLEALNKNIPMDRELY